MKNQTGDFSIMILVTILAITLLAGCSSSKYGALAIGNFRESVGTIADAGAVNIIRGSANGLNSSSNQIWSKATDNIAGEPLLGESFGSALASGDFNNDGYADLAIGGADDSPGTTIRAGSVHVIYGTIAGLRSAGSQVWGQSSAGIVGEPEDADTFGASLAVGDFNNDGYDDLAIGGPSESVGTVTSAGSVNVIYGSETGLSSSGNQIWNQSSDNIDGVAEAFDKFGSSLTAGDFNNDGFDDLAIGVPLESVGAIDGAGAVNVLYGAANGLRSAGNQIWSQESNNIVGAPEEDDRFGSSLTAGDFNSDGFDDLAIGVEREDVGTLEDAGSVNVIYGTANGLRSADNQLWNQSSDNIEGVAEAFDNFGASLAAGDFDNDDFADLVIGVPRESVGTTLSAGSVNVIYGTAAGLSSAGDQIWNHSSPGIQGALDNGDSFGTALAAGDFNNDGFADLAVGSPWKDIEPATGAPGISNAGAVTIIYGAANGLNSTGNQIWGQFTDNIRGEPEDNDLFGMSLVYLKGYTSP